MKILLVSHKFPPYSLGGVEVYTRNLAHALQREHEVGIFFRHDEPGARGFSEHDERVGGILVQRVSHPPDGMGASVAGEFLSTFANRRIEGSFSRLVDRFHPDLIHIQHVMALSAGILHIARRQGIPVVLTLHDYWFICGNSQLVWPDRQTCRGKALGMNCVRCAAAARFPSPLVRWLRPVLAPLFLYRDRVARQAAKQADLLISPSRFLIDKYVDAGFPRQRFRYLENGIDLEQLRRFPSQATDGKLRVSFLGSLAWQKGVHILVEAFNDLPKGVARLRIWGDPAVFPEYSQRLQHTLTHPDGGIMGRIENERVGEVLASSDVMVVPSLWYENSPVVIQEARAAGIPVVASGLGALAEKVRHEVDGLLFPPGNASALNSALLRLVDEPGLMPHLRENIPDPMSIDEHVLALDHVYQQLLRDRGR